MDYFISRISETHRVTLQTSQPSGCIQCFPFMLSNYFQCISIVYLLGSVLLFSPFTVLVIVRGVFYQVLLLPPLVFIR